MGDRGNVVIKQNGESVDLYSHSGGTELPSVVQKALASPAGKARRTDAPYLARIIFDVMTEGEHGEETGYGIWASQPDSNHDDVVVDCDAQTVSIGSLTLSMDAFCKV